MLYFLLLSVLILFFIALVAYEGEILSPPTIICAMFLPAILATIYNKDRWGVVLHWNTYCVITGGLSLFVMISIAARYIYKKMLKKVGNTSLKGESSYLKIENWKVNVLFVYVNIISIVYLYYVRKNVGIYYGNNLGWTETMSRFRYLSSYGNGNVNIPGIINQGYQFVTFIGIFVVYILLHNYIVCGIIQRNLLVLVIFSAVGSLLDSGRLNIIIYVVVVITLYDAFRERYKGKGVKVSFKFLSRAMTGFIVFCGVFVLLKKVAGRMDDRDPFYYITYYLGQSIRNLDIYLQKSWSKPKLWGKETFYGWNHLLYLMTGKDKYNYIVHKEFLYYKGISTGNVYTMFRAFIHDFGYGGLIILTSLFAFIISVWYLRIKFRGKTRRYDACDRSLIYYSYLMFTVYTAFFADYFFYRIVSFFWIKFLLSVFLLEIFLIRLKFMKGMRYESNSNANSDYSNL